MIAEEIYYYFKGALPTRLCDEIIKYGSSLTKELGVTGSEQKTKKPIRPLTAKEKKEPIKIRKSNVAWINDPWVYKEIRPYVARANQEAKWNFDIDGYERIQFTEYSRSQHYGYHVDTFFDQPDSMRKLSMTVNLNSPDEYEGGDLYFKYLRRNDHTLVEATNPEFKIKGTLCVFPSYEIHKVTPVTKGTRYSLVLWSTGKAFK